MKYSNNNLYARITSSKDFFTNIEQKISDKLFENPKKFITYSMSELSEITGVSQGSINNFAKKYTGGGFSELKLQIASELESFLPKQHTIVEQNDGITDVMKKLITNTQTSFTNTILNNTEETLNHVVEKILMSKRIEIYGIYQSGIVANNLYYRLLELGISVAFVSDVLTCSVSASMLDSECLVIAISSSGKTSDIINAVKTAKENNVPVICITADMNSPLAKLSDDVLIASSSGKSVTGSSAEILMSEFFLLDSIYTYIESKKYKNFKTESEHYYKLKKILNSHNVRELEISNKEN